ncbi:SusC/RagA family TonB-linked outer membrane protein [Pedobacter jeongneungensis]|uniref:SusC/RagA family TonB-linked outer membrane protein n=1 Tax=Pedobacter jeongneungensis TaxID=947309 RepID=UPI000468849A|nr:SusC/RagA family TonB-linked outer membrane protein [Pedobacter jeongneungensis]
MKKRLQSLFILLFFTISVMAQERTITGTVTSQDDKSPIPGVNVKVKGTQIGVSTDANGKFSISLPSSSSTLEFSFIGYTTQSRAVSGAGPLNIVLVPDSKSLSDVVVTGYTVQNKKDATSAISKVSADQFKDTPVADPNELLKGRVTGVVVTSGSGQPGAVQSVRIRGINSISSGNNPLYVIDGVVVARGDFNTDTNSDLQASNQVTPTDILSNLNPNDIESFDVLKDASAIALYGARGANGVIVITTKKGKIGAPEFNVRAQYGKTKANFGNFKLMDASQFLAYEKIGLSNAGVDDADIPGSLTAAGGNSNFNWMDAAFRTGTSSNFDISARGGNEGTKYYFSSGIGKLDGTLIGSGIKKYSLLSNIEQKINSRFTMGLNLNLSYSDGLTSADGSRYGSPILGYIATAPIQSPYKPDGSLYNGRESGWFGLTGDNFLYNTQYNFNSNKNFRTLGRLYGDLKIFDWLKLSENLSVDWINAKQKLYQDARTSDGFGQNGSLFDSAIDNKLYTTQTSLSGSYAPNADHSLTYLAMLEYSFKENAGVSANGKSIIANDRFRSLNAAILPVSVGGSSSTQAILSYIGNATYSYQSKYNLNVSLRRDEASNFKNNKAETFYAVGGAWRIINEDFMKEQKVLSNAKLRASYGTSGNLSGLLDFVSYTLWTPVNYNDNPGLAPFQLGNDDLRWEKTKSFDLGLELGFLNNRISLEADYYSKKTNQQLFSLPISSTSGFITMPVNIGQVQNRGFELALNTVNLEGAVNWKTNFNVSFSKNRVNETKDGQDLVIGQNITRVGFPVGSWYMREWAGVDPANGDPLWFKADGTTTNNYNLAERRIIGQALPKYTFGLTNIVSYKDLELSFLFYGATGNMIYNQTRSFVENTAYINSGFSHSVQAGEDFWQKPGDNVSRPKPIAGGNKNESSPSSRYLEKGDYLRLKNVRLSYSLPSSILGKTGIKKITFFGQGENLVTWTGYTGVDPETDASGTEFFKYPVGKIYTFGLNATF